MRVKEKKPTGPVPEILKIQGDWKDSIKKAISKKKPIDGWPKPEPKKK